MANPYATERFLRNRIATLREALQNLTLNAHAVLEVWEDPPTELSDSIENLAATVAEAEEALRSTKV